MAKAGNQREFTVADVAREAGVSKAQAARALGAYGAVSDAVRSRVLAAAARLNYRPNQTARTLNTGRSHSVGVVVGDIENPYFSLATRGISDAVERSGFNVVLANTSERVTAERAAVDMLMDKRVDGLVVAPASASDAAHLRAVVDAGRPLVLLDRTVPGLAVDAARAEIEPAAREAADLLLALGHRRIGYITTADGGHTPLPSPVAARVAGLVGGFTDHGLTWDPGLLRPCPHEEAAIRRAVADLVRGADPATALIASDSLIGQVVVGALQEEGLRIPDDVSVLMYDDQPWARLVTPPITVVAQPTYDIGFAAGERLAALIGGATNPPPLVPLPATLIRRGSVGPVGGGPAARS
ncbi:LacI family DNA-binding transcriptional regulator [Sphaerisporangium fuscum]|uniref:LacI family DNA-binding transcriptional regulator n=1 Tax=Sphaerisporangium fuscum TaxID=2835868 RepID=UPI001BDC69AE|nr:LacI family DNA-binding transcriptional regulator [Sphaerisporangium fuscum]